MRLSLGVLVLPLALAIGFAVAQDRSVQDPGQAAPPSPPASQPAERPAAAGPLDFTVKNIDGKTVPLSKYRGEVVLIVNVASQCGLTPQYEQLEQLYRKYKDRGLRIAAFPANNFRAQEPGTNAEIKQFCREKYDVTFDLYEKISVKGDDQAELYRFLTSKDRNGEFGGEIQWNFTKFLIGRDGKVVARFEPKVNPDDPAVLKAVEAALAAPRPGVPNGRQPKGGPAAKGA